MEKAIGWRRWPWWRTLKFKNMDFDFLQYLPEEQRERFGKEVAELLMARTLKKFHAALSARTKESFEKIMKDGAPEEQTKFIGRHKTLFQQILVAEGVQLDREIAAGMESQAA